MMQPSLDKENREGFNEYQLVGNTTTQHVLHEIQTLHLNNSKAMSQAVLAGGNKKSRVLRKSNRS